MTQMNTFGLIGLTEENVGVDRRFYTGLTSTNGTFAVSYNAGRVDVFLNGIKLVGNHTGNANYDYTMDSTTGTGSTITLATGVALVSADVIECVGYVSNSSNTVTSYNPTPASGDGGWNVFINITHTASDLVNVFLNGVLLDDSDYTLDASNNKVTIGGATLTASDVVVIQVIGALDHNNFVPAGGGTFTGNLAFSGKELTLDADGDTSIHAESDDQIDIKVGGTDVGNFNSNTLKLVKDGTPVLEIEDTAETNYSGAWLTAPEMHFRHSTADANSQGVLGILKFKGTTKTDLGVASTAGTVDIAQLQARSYEGSSGVGQRYSDVTGGFSFRGMNGAGGFTELMSIEGKNLKIQSGGGINFSAYATSGNPSSNLLDDYEEGTWTPTVSSASGSSTLSDGSGLSESEGWYTKIGRMVFCQFYIQFSNISGLSGTILVANLPFPVADLLPNTGIDGFGHFNYFGNLNTTSSTLTILLNGGTSQGELYRLPGSGATTMSSANETNLTNTTSWRGYLSYATT